MTEETKNALLKWITANTQSPGRSIFNFDGNLAAVEIDGDMDLGELAESIESAERERCAKIADSEAQSHDGNRDPAWNSATSIAEDIRGGPR